MAMRWFVTRAANIILHPETEWAVIARERGLWARYWSYLALLILIPPLAFGGQMVLGREGALRTFADPAAALRFALLSAGGGIVAALLSVTAMAGVIWLLAPLFAGRRSLRDAFRLVVFAGTPVWLSGVILIAPLNRFALLIIIILIAGMHGLFLVYLGVHHVLGVPRGDAAECSAIVVAAGFLLSTVAGYYASAAGLFP